MLYATQHDLPTYCWPIRRRRTCRPRGRHLARGVAGRRAAPGARVAYHGQPLSRARQTVRALPGHSRGDRSGGTLAALILADCARWASDCQGAARCWRTPHSAGRQPPPGVLARSRPSGRCVVGTFRRSAALAPAGRPLCCASRCRWQRARRADCAARYAPPPPRPHPAQGAPRARWCAYGANVARPTMRAALPPRGSGRSLRRAPARLAAAGAGPTPRAAGLNAPQALRGKGGLLACSRRQGCPAARALRGLACAVRARPMMRQCGAGPPAPV